MRNRISRPDYNRMEKIILHAILLQTSTSFIGRQLAHTCRNLGMTDKELSFNSYQKIIFKYCDKHPSKGKSWIRRSIGQQLPMELNVKSNEETKVKLTPAESATIKMTEEQMIDALKATGNYRIYRITQIEI